jgi:hypothetical protein
MMNKDDIKYKLRESLMELSEEKEKSEEGEKEGDKERNTKKDYSDVQLALDKVKDPTAPSQVGVMKKMGIPDDKKGVNRSLFGKKLHQEKNDDGGLYQFDDKELSRLRGIIDAR